jgi:GntR family transcriptional regulator
VRETRYQSIADELRRRVQVGDLGAAKVLPSESDLSEQYAASRVTVRRALEILRDEGLVDSRQGFGWFVPSDPLRQTLGRLGTIERQLSDEGVESTRRVLDFRFVAAPARARQVLGCESVLRVRRLNLADVERSPFYELLPVPLGGATQTIGAALATAAEADLLQVPPGSAVLRCERTTRSVEEVPVLLSEHVFPAHLTVFEVDLPHVEASMAPTGLRLVE